LATPFLLGMPPLNVTSFISIRFMLQDHVQPGYLYK
jgi:hypothetical protein